MPGIRSSRARLPSANTRWSYGKVISPLRACIVSRRDCVSTEVTEPMMNCWMGLCGSISRTGTTTCSGNTEAPTASGSIGLKVV